MEIHLIIVELAAKLPLELVFDPSNQLIDCLFYFYIKNLELFRVALTIRKQAACFPKGNGYSLAQEDMSSMLPFTFLKIFDWKTSNFLLADNPDAHLYQTFTFHLMIHYISISGTFQADD